MTRTCLHPIMITALVLAVSVSPTNAAGASSLEKLRQQSLQRISKFITQPVRQFSYRRMLAKLDDDAANNGPVREGEITLLPLECSRRFPGSPVFKVRMRSDDGKKSSIVVVTVPLGYITMPMDWDSTKPWPKGFPDYDEVAEIRISIQPEKGHGLDDLTHGDDYTWKYGVTGDITDRNSEDYGWHFLISRATDYKSGTDVDYEGHQEGITLPIDDIILAKLIDLCLAENAERLSTLTSDLEALLKSQ